MSIDLVTIIPCHLHLNDDLFKIRRDFFNDDARTPIRRIQIVTFASSGCYPYESYYVIIFRFTLIQDAR